MLHMTKEMGHKSVASANLKRDSRKAKAAYMSSPEDRFHGNSSRQVWQGWTGPPGLYHYSSSKSLVEELTLLFALFGGCISWGDNTASTSPEWQHPHCADARGAEARASRDRCWGPAQISCWEFCNPSVSSSCPTLSEVLHGIYFPPPLLRHWLTPQVSSELTGPWRTLYPWLCHLPFPLALTQEQQGNHGYCWTSAAQLVPPHWTVSTHARLWTQVLLSWVWFTMVFSDMNRPFHIDTGPARGMSDICFFFLEINPKTKLTAIDNLNVVVF